MTNHIAELFTQPTGQDDMDWKALSSQQACAYLQRKCLKTRKSQPEVSIGTCSIHQRSSLQRSPLIICPHRFLERGQVFMDCLHLLTLHEPGNQLHRVAEIEIPGGNIDYFLVPARAGKVIDFVGIELQAVDTTGSLWDMRQQFLAKFDEEIPTSASLSPQYGVNWKMTAKTTLIQLHHKVETFQNLSKHLVLVLQGDLLSYMQRTFSFSGVQTARLGDAMHFHAYSLTASGKEYQLSRQERLSTDARGVALALGMQSSANVDMDIIIAKLQRRLSDRTLLQL